MLSGFVEAEVGVQQTVMDPVDTSVEVLSMASLILLLTLNCHRSLSLAVAPDVAQDDEPEDTLMYDVAGPQAHDYVSVAEAVFNHFRLWSNLSVVDEDLGFWVKPRSTVWFSRFLLEEYDDHRWVQLFRMTKTSIFSLARLLTPHIQRQDTNYRAAVPVIVRLSCVLFKLSQGASLLICSEMFAIGRSTVSIILREVVHGLNVVLKHEMQWPRGERLNSIVGDFHSLCGLPAVAGAIDGTHFGIKKPRIGSVDYYYFKSGGFAISCQAVVDSSKRFLDIYVGMPGSTNDSRMLRRSTLFSRGQGGTLWTADSSFDGFSPFLLGDAGYPLLPWLMVPHRRTGHLSMADSLFNRKLSKGRSVVENAFAMLKMTFRELRGKSELSLRFLPDVVSTCALLHNVLLQQNHDDVERLLQILQVEAANVEGNPRRDVLEIREGQPEHPPALASEEKRSHLGVYLSLQRVYAGFD